MATYHKISEKWRYIKWKFTNFSCSFSANECVSDIQGRPRSMILVPIKSMCATSYDSVTVTYGNLLAEKCYFFYPLPIRRHCSICSLWKTMVNFSTKKQES